MRARFGVLALVLGFAVMTVACGAPPTADIDAAKAAITAATTAGASDYAAASLKATEDAQAALDAELKAQEGKWFKSYDKAKQLAIDVKTAGEKAATDAAAGKEKAKVDATQAIADAKAALTEAEGLLAKAPKGKGSAADIEAMKTDLATAATVGDRRRDGARERHVPRGARQGGIGQEGGRNRQGSRRDGQGREEVAGIDGVPGGAHDSR